MAKRRGIPLWKQFAGPLGMVAVVAGGLVLASGSHSFYFQFLASSQPATGWFDWDLIGFARLAIGFAAVLLGSFILTMRPRRRRLDSADPESDRMSQWKLWRHRLLIMAVGVAAFMLIGSGGGTLIATFRSESESAEVETQVDVGWPAWDAYGVVRLLAGGVSAAILLRQIVASQWRTRVQPRIRTMEPKWLSLLGWSTLLAFFTLAILFLVVVCGTPRVDYGPSILELEKELETRYHIRRARRYEYSYLIGTDNPNYRQSVADADFHFSRGLTEKLERYHELQRNGQDVPKWIWVMLPQGYFANWWNALRVLWLFSAAMTSIMLLRMRRNESRIP